MARCTRARCCFGIHTTLALLLALSAVVAAPTAALAAADGYEPDGTFGQAVPIPVDGTIQYKTADPVGDLDWVSFTAVAGRMYELRTGPHDSLPDVNYDTRLILYDTDGATELGNNDDAGWSNYSLINWTAPASGTYFLRASYYWLPGYVGKYGVRVRDITESGVGTITGTVTDVSGAPLGGIDVDAFDALGGVYGGAYGGTVTFADGSYTIAGLPNGQYRVRFTDPSGAHLAEYFDGPGYAGSGIVTVTIDGTAAGVDVVLNGPATAWPLDAHPDPVALLNQPVRSAVDTAGNVYVTEIGSDRIQKFAPDGTWLDTWGPWGGGSAEGQFTDPNGIEVGADGLVYVADTGNNRIQVLEQDGTFVTAWATTSNPYDVALDDTATALYVVEGAVNAVQVFQPDGTPVTAWGAAGSGPGQFSAPQGIDVDSDGLVYVADTDNNRVQALLPDGTFVSEFTNVQVTSPNDVAVTPEGLVFVSNPGLPACMIFDGNGATVGSIVNIGYLDGQFQYPTGIYVGPADGTIYITDGDPRMRRVSRWAGDLSADYLGTIGSEGASGERFRDPYGIAVAPDGSHAVADTGNHRVSVFDVGVSVRTFGEYGTGNGQFNGPRGVCMDAAGDIYVADTENHRIQKFDNAGTFVAAWGTRGTGPAQMRRPRAVDWVDDGIHTGGVLFVLDTGNNRVVAYDTDGAPLAWSPGFFSTPEGLGAEPDGSGVWVSSTGSDQIVHLDWSGSDESFANDSWYGGSGSNLGYFNEPRGIAVDAGGDVWVADTFNDRVQRLDSAGNVEAVFGLTGYITGHMDNPCDVGLSADGTIYVLEKVSERVSRWVVDDTPPVTSWPFAGWQPGPASVHITATDDISGVDHIYLTDGSVSQTSSPDADFTVTAEGTTTLSYWAIDVAGNREDTRTLDVLVDNTRPVTSIEASVVPGSAEITFTTTDALSGVEFTRYSLDDGPDLDGTHVTVTAPGNHTLWVWSGDNAGNAEPPIQFDFTVVIDVPDYESFEGATRYDTAVLASRSQYGTGSVDTVVIASGADWPDALAAAPLAGAYGVPVLLVPPTAVPAAVTAEITRLGATDAIIIGGIAAVPAATQTALDAQLSGTVSRIAGPNRYATAAQVAEAVEAKVILDGGTPDGVMVLASGSNFADALSGSSLAAANAWPVMFTPQAMLAGDTGTKILTLGFNRAVVLGGTGAVSDAVAGQVQALLTGPGASVVRLGGADRYATSLLIAGYGVSDGGMTWDGVGIATGQNYPDALAGGPVCGMTRSVLVITPTASLYPPLGAELGVQEPWIATVRFFGGTGALSPAVRNQVHAILD